MNKLKITIAAALLMCGTTVFAGNPKTDDAKKDAKTEVKATPAENDGNAKRATFTYHVTGLSPNGDGYTLDTNSDPDCNGGSSPCEITSPTALSSPISKAAVDQQQNGIQIQSWQPQLQ